MKSNINLHSSVVSSRSLILLCNKLTSFLSCCLISLILLVKLTECQHLHYISTTAALYVEGAAQLWWFFSKSFSACVYHYLSPNWTTISTYLFIWWLSNYFFVGRPVCFSHVEKNNTELNKIHSKSNKI